jgi:NAD(P)-dependent dehydrogenase (short-subunit alcohol dehydrogenase family)
MSVRFDGRVALVVGAGAGLGRSAALGLAARGAKVVVNDFGAGGEPPESVLRVTAEIKRAGGFALADGADALNAVAIEAMIDRVAIVWGGVDILVAAAAVDAGATREASFAEIDIADFRRALDVRLTGAAICAKAAWPGMRARHYGRIVFASSAAGLYGGVGQADAGAATAGLIGLMNALHLEGAKHDIRVNLLAPVVVSPGSESLLPPEAAAALTPESATPGLLFLVGEQAPSRLILSAGAGVFAVTHLAETPGVYFAPEERTPEAITVRFAEIAGRDRAVPLDSAFAETFKFVAAAAKAQAGAKPK